MLKYAHWQDLLQTVSTLRLTVARMAGDPGDHVRIQRIVHGSRSEVVQTFLRYAHCRSVWHRELAAVARVVCDIVTQYLLAGVQRIGADPRMNGRNERTVTTSHDHAQPANCIRSIFAPDRPDSTETSKHS